MKTLFSRIGVANDGLGYSTQLSPSSLRLTAMSTKTLVVHGKYAYQVGDSVRIVLAADTTKFITGKISTITESATDTTYAIYASAVSAVDTITNYTGWKLSLAGVNGVNGISGAAGVGYPQLDLTGGSYSYPMQVGGIITLTSVTSLTNKGYAVGTNVQLTGLDQTTYEPAAYGYGKITAINGSDITIAVETVQGDMVNNFNSYALNLSGVRGATGADGVPTNRNHIINGAFDVWQRGAVVTHMEYAGSSAAYTADRFQIGLVQDGVAWRSVTVTRSTNTAPNFTYSAKVTSNDTSVNRCLIMQNIEDTNVLNGKQVTVTFWIRRIATCAAGTLIAVNSGVAVADFNSLSTSDFTRVQHTFTFPSIGSLRIEVKTAIPSTPLLATTGDLFEVTGIQLEAGSIVTPFQRNAPSLQGELAACQRYYYRATVDGVGDSLGVGNAEDVNIAAIYTQFPVEMRISPTALLTSGVAADYSVRVAGSTQAVAQSPTYLTATKWNATTTFTTSTSAMTAGQAVQARAGSSNAYLAWSAEL